METSQRGESEDLVSILGLLTHDLVVGKSRDVSISNFKQAAFKEHLQRPRASIKHMTSCFVIIRECCVRSVGCLVLPLIPPVASRQLTFLVVAKCLLSV